MTRGAIESAEREWKVYQALVSAAERGDKAPANWLLAEMVGNQSMATGARLVARLEERGLIAVERTRCSRVITIVASGKRTAPSRTSSGPRKGASAMHAQQRRADLRRQAEQLVTDANTPAERRRDARKLSATVHDPLPIARLCPVLAAPACPADPRPPAFSRAPCPRCGTRGELGCAHQAPFEPAEKDERS